MDDEAHTTKNRFIRFNPTINSGHIVTAMSVLFASVFAWAQLRTDVNRLLTENDVRKIEIEKVNSVVHEEVKELQTAITQRFDRIEDKLDRKKDK
jgi:hypothetical protein